MRRYTKSARAGQKAKFFRVSSGEPIEDSVLRPLHTDRSASAADDPQRQADAGQGCGGGELAFRDGYSPNTRQYWFANRPGFENPYLVAISETEHDPLERMMSWCANSSRIRRSAAMGDIPRKQRNAACSARVLHPAADAMSSTVRGS